MTFLTTSLAVLATALHLWLLTRATRQPSRGTLAARCLLIATGIVLGVGVTLRPEAILFALVAVAWTSHAGGADRRVRFPRVLLLAGLCLPLLPPIAFNTLRSGRVAFVSANGADNFLIGNLHDAPGNSPDHTPTYFEMKRHEGTGSTTLLRAALGDIAAHPRAAARLQLRKLGYFWGGYEIPNNLNFYLARHCNRALAMLPFQFWLVLPLAVLGMGVAVAQRRRCTLLYLFTGVFALTSVMFFVLSRLRQPVVVALIAFAGSGVAWWVERVRAREYGRAALVLAVVSGSAWLLRPQEVIRPTDFAMAAAAYFSRGQDFEARDNPKAAQAEYIHALVLNPAHEPALDRLRVLTARDGNATAAAARVPEVDALCSEARSLATAQQYDGALRLLLQAECTAPESIEVYRDLANVYFLMGNTERAATALEHAVRLSPLDEQLRRNLWVLRGSP